MAKGKVRYFKQAQRQHLNQQRENISKKKHEINNPKVDKRIRVQEMQRLWAQTKKTQKTLILDVDGTLTQYKDLKRNHKKIRLRPFFDKFINEVKQFADVYIFSSSPVIRLNNLWNRFFKEHCNGLFDKRFHYWHRKDLVPLLTLSPDLIMIDDDLEAFTTESKASVLGIKRWTGEENDSELLKVLQKIKLKWNIKY